MKRKYNISPWSSVSKEEKGCFLSFFHSVKDRDFTVIASKSEAISFIKSYTWNSRQLLKEIEKMDFSKI